MIQQLIATQGHLRGILTLHISCTHVAPGPPPLSQLVHFSRGNKRIPLLASPPPPPHQLQSSWFVALGVNMRRRSRGSRVRVLHADKATRCCAIAGCVGKRNVFDLYHLRGVAFPPAYLKEHF